MSICPFTWWQHWETSKSWHPFQEKYKSNILGTASHGPRLFLELTRNISDKFLRKLRAESLRNCPRNPSRTHSCIVGALSKLDELLLKPQIRTLLGIVPGTSRNTDFENQEPSGDCSQNIPILNWSSLFLTLATQLTRTQKRPVTIGITDNMLFWSVPALEKPFRRNIGQKFELAHPSSSSDSLLAGDL